METKITLFSVWVNHMGKFTEEDINRILDLHSVDGKLIDVFDLHGVLYIGNCRDGITIIEHGKVKTVHGWDLTKTHTQFSEHLIGMDIDEFEDCETEEDVRNRFAECLEEAVKEKLV